MNPEPIVTPLQLVLWMSGAGILVGAAVRAYDWLERGLARRRARIAWERLKKGGAR